MKYRLPAAFFFALIILYTGAKAQTTNRPNYPLKFRYTNTAGIQKDTILTRLAYKFWCKSTAYPSYVKWKNQPFAVLRSPINGVGLFTDSASSFNTGDTIGIAFYKIAGTGKFDIDFFQSNLGSFVNDADTPNTQVVSTPQGLLLQATQSIGPVTELTVSYQSILNLFPNDPSVVRAIQYW